ncbi:Ig-like domain-containing protein [Flavicella sp.]|nr:Ig-like domain-containing protein [Flavicella sp.]MDA9111808.1 Ig-like domain-containing protein [Flavicella sp.]
MKNLLLLFTVLILTAGFTSNCARKGNPMGGPKDSISPVMVTANPAYKSIHFKSKKIKLDFDEYVKFKDLNKQLIVSPPLNHPSLIKPSGTASKTISIEIMDTLKENTTYAFNFGNSIVDNNEGNRLGSFKYVFSTGSYVDSLEVQGVVSDAFEEEVADNIAVLLYEIDSSYTDSLVYKEKPDYVTSTLDSVSFDLTNIKKGSYQMIALNDYNNNYLFNPKQDQIAFVKNPVKIPTEKAFHLRMFSETPPFQLKRPLESGVGKIIFGFEGNARPLDIKLLTTTPDAFKSFVNLEKETDTLNYWYVPFETDSLQFQVTGKNLDTLFTVQLRTSKMDSLTLNAIYSRTLHPKDTFALESNIPLESIDPSQIRLFDKDTLQVKFSPFLNSSKMKISLDFQRKPKEDYLLEILPNTVVDFYGSTNDTLVYRLKTLDNEAYGAIEMDVQGLPNTALIAELYSEKEGVIERQFSNGKNLFVFEQLVPKTYKFRVISDSNKNGKWDTGSFLKKLQPEEVFYYPQEIKLRANWTVNETFVLEPQPSIIVPVAKDSLRK